MSTLPSFGRARAGLARTALWTLLLILAAGPLATPSVAATGDNQAAVEEKNPDPFERFNRSIYRFNDRVDRAVLRPLAVRYAEYVPPKVRRGIKNFGQNLREPTTIVNNLLQGKVNNAAEDTFRFLVNSTVGLLGIFDVAGALGVERNHEDFGQTLGRWGVPSGPYLVLPFLGPSNVRDAAGLIPQYMYTDLTAGIDDDALLWSIFAVRAVDTRSDLLKADRLLEEQIDPYVFVREAYRQRRVSDIYDGNPPREEDEFLDELLKEGN